MGKAGKLRRWVLRLIISAHTKTHNSDSLLMSSAIYRHLSNELLSPSSLEASEPIPSGRLNVYVDEALHTPEGRVAEQKIGPIVRSHVAFQHWRRPTPRGHVAVYVGEEGERFLVPIAYLSHPLLEGLLQMSASEFGYAHTAGLRIPCSPSLFHRTLSLIHTQRSFTHKHKKISLGQS